MFGTAITVDAASFRGARRVRQLRTIPWVGTQEAEAVMTKPTRGNMGKEEWFAPNAGVVWRPEDEALVPVTITSFQAVLMGQLDIGTRLMDAHELQQLRRLWVSDRLPDGTLGPRRRPSRGEAADWLGMNDLHSITRASLWRILPCISDSARRREAGPYSTCKLGNMCLNCGKAWELMGQAWHLPSILSVMGPWVALAVRQWAEEREGLRGSYPWTHPVHQCRGGDLCPILTAHHATRGHASE